MSDFDDDDLVWMFPGTDYRLQEVIEQTRNWIINDRVEQHLKEDRAAKFSFFAAWSAYVGKVRDTVLITTALETRVSKVPALLVAGFALPIWGALGINMSRERWELRRIRSNVRWVCLLK